MKKLMAFSAILGSIATTAFGQCTSLFSFTTNSNTASFCNLSNVSNAHYFWNFGDGTGSNIQNPIHTFPETGEYLVTLFAEDTVTNCSTYYEHWVVATKYSLNMCQPKISDTIYDTLGSDNLKIIDNSINCDNYFRASEDGGPGQSIPINHPIYLGGYYQTTAFRMVCRGIYFDSNWNVMREAYKSAYHNYSSSHNYGDSSANFEFTVVSKDSLGERIFFKAMNKTAIFYQWYISGFGNAITSNYDTISQFYPKKDGDFWIVELIVHGSKGGHDTISQNILTNDSVNTIARKLENVNVCCDSSIVKGQNVQFSSSGGSTYFWMPPNGLSCDSCSNPIVSPIQSTTYTVNINDSGCVFERTVTVDVSCNIFVPTAFSPNEAHNNILYVRGPCIQDLYFTIYDRWGNKVFETENINNGWDGNHNGQPMNTGTYMYYAKATMFDGSTVEKHGSVALVR